MGARLEEVQLLINKTQPSCICLLEILLDNPKYNINRKYDLYATILPEQRSKGGEAKAVRKDISHRRLDIRTTIQASHSSGNPTYGEKQENIMFSLPSPPKHSKRGRHKGAPRLAFNTNILTGRLKRTQYSMGQ